MSLNNRFYELVVNKLIDDQITTIQSKNQVYIDKKSISNLLYLTQKKSLNKILSLYYNNNYNYDIKISS